MAKSIPLKCQKRAMLDAAQAQVLHGAEGVRSVLLSWPTTADQQYGRSSKSCKDLQCSDHSHHSRNNQLQWLYVAPTTRNLPRPNADRSQQHELFNAVISYRDRPGRELGYEEWLKGISAVAQTFPGHQGVSFIATQPKVVL